MAQVGYCEQQNRSVEQKNVKTIFLIFVLILLATRDNGNHFFCAARKLREKDFLHFCDRPFAASSTVGKKCRGSGCDKAKVQLRKAI